MDDKLDDIQQCLDKYDGKLEYSLENQRRCNKINIDGIPEKTKESWSVTKGVLEKVSLEKLHLESEPTIEQAHWTCGKCDQVDLEIPLNL